MIHLGLVGYPLDHSLSPTIHAAALKACNLEGDYSLYSIQPDDMRGLENLLKRLRSGEVIGLNVTIPHKQNVVQFLDELTPKAKAIGAVNTIYLRDHQLIGDNTDSSGFLIDLNCFLASDQSRIEDLKSAMVLGAGGSARAVVYALINDAWKVTIAARRVDQAEELALQFKDIRAIELNRTSIQDSKFRLIVNTTPVGMAPNIDHSPWPEGLLLPDNISVYDLVYNPRETKFVRDARSHGYLAETGIGMLVEQAALAFEIWTGHHPPRDILFQSIDH
jgi:shikimate dehydrogenase